MTSLLSSWFSFPGAFYEKSPPAANSLASHHKQKTVEVTKALAHFKAPPPLLDASLERKKKKMFTIKPGVFALGGRAHMPQTGPIDGQPAESMGAAR